MSIKINALLTLLKGHGNETDFLGFLQKSVPRESLTLHFEPFRFRIEFVEIFVIEKQVGESTRLSIDTISFKPLNKSMVIGHTTSLAYFLPNLSYKN
jgi:hypothetical protein